MNLLRRYARRQMAFPQSTRPRRIAALLLAAVVALLGLALKENFSADSYDLLHSLSLSAAKKFSDDRVVIVYLDLASYLHERQDPTARWSRALHARLLDRLAADGARAVALDILFDEPGESPADDAAFAAALKKNSRVILAAEHSNKNSHATSADESWARLTVLNPPYEPFARAAAGWGVASLVVDDDFTVRRHLPEIGADRLASLSLATARFTALTNATPGLWLRYYGPALTLPHVSYSEALDLNALPKNFFHGKIVFVGARPITSSADAQRDEFRSPFHSWRNKEFFMPGVEVHATQLLNLLRGDALKRLSSTGENLLLVFTALLFGGGLLWFRPLPATVLAFLGAGSALLVSLAGFSANVWFPWLVVGAVQIPAALFGSWLWQFQEWFFTRRKLEAAKKIADAKIREQAALLDKAHDAILVQSLDGEILYANPSAEKLLGAPSTSSARTVEANERAEQVLGAPVAEIFSADPATAAKARATALRDGEWNGEIKLQTADGSLVIAASRWTLIRDEINQPSALLLINSDITEKKNLEQQFLRTQRMNTIGTLAGGMAHDLNNALSPVLLGAQLLRRKATSEDDKKLLSLIETSANRGADMVRQVLLFARGRGGEFERLELGPLVKDLEKMCRETFPKNISVETFVPRDLWPVQGNLTQLHQVLLNLCVNARDAMPDGGKISFVADNVELKADELAQLRAGFGAPSTRSARTVEGDERAERVLGAPPADPDPRPQTPDAKFISLLVSDTGTGMTPEVKAKIFEPFFTTKGEGKGTGIGLATVVRILQAHGGFLRVESEPGHGTSFEVFLACAPEFIVEEKAQAVENLLRGHGELILLADDEQALCELVAAELTEFGYRVITAANGAEAVTLYRQHAAEVRVLITDNSMPLMTGPQAIAEIRKLNPKLPVILASGEGGAGLAGVMELEKPFALADLLNMVSGCLK